MVARFPRSVLEETLDCRLRDEPGACPIEIPEVYGAGFGEQCFFFFDWTTGERLPATQQQTVDMIRLGHACPEVSHIGTPVVSNEVHPAVEAVEAIELMMANTSKRCGTGIRCAEQTPYIFEIDRLCEKHGDPRRFTQHGGCLTTPLTLGERTAGIVEALMDLGEDTFRFSSMPIAGANAPVTTAGCVVMGVAALLGGRLVARALNRDDQGVGMMISGTMDMTHGRASLIHSQKPRFRSSGGIGPDRAHLYVSCT